MMLDWKMRLMTLEVWLEAAVDTVAEYCEEMGIEKPDTAAVERLVGWVRAAADQLDEGPISDDGLPF